jgi:E3 ubiquitin-protein ligase HECTD1
MIQDLMVKGKDEFLEHFARLGVFSKVGALAGPQDAPPEPEILPSSSSSSSNNGSNNSSNNSSSNSNNSNNSNNSSALTVTGGEELKLEDAKELLIGKAYHWRDWCVCRGRDCLYVWSDAAALELSNGSNGWFRFILDGKLATMYSSGSPEGGADNGSNKAFFFQLLACPKFNAEEQNL